MFSEFTKKYSLSKTLRFELKPVGRTLEHIKHKGLLEKDEERAREYKVVKSIIDEYHKDFIERALSSVSLRENDLNDLANAYEEAKQKDKESKNKFSYMQTLLRREIVKVIESTDGYKNLFKEDLVKKDLLQWIKEKYSGVELVEKTKVLKDFERFTTYFKGFHDNRRNMYTAEEKPTAIAYRVIHENFPKFYENCKRFDLLVSRYACIDFSVVEKEFSSELGERKLKEFITLSNFTNCINQSGIDKFNLIRGGKVIGENKIQGINEIINLYIQQKQSKAQKSSQEEKNVINKEIHELRSCKMSELYKQILSDRVSGSFLLDKIEDDNALVTVIKLFYENELINYKDGLRDINVLSVLESILKEQLLIADLKKVYVKNGSCLTDISQAIFGDYSVIVRALTYYIQKKNPSRKENPSKKELLNWDNWVKKTRYFNIQEIESAIKDYLEYMDTNEVCSKKELKEPLIVNYFSSLESVNKANKELIGNNDSIDNCCDSINHYYNEIKEVLNNNYSVGSKKLVSDKDAVKKIKNFLDSIQSLLNFLRPLYIIVDIKNRDNGNEVYDKDNSFYGQFEFCYDHLKKIIPLYNKCRNYLTQKPYSVEKYKLNFENSTLLNGWDENKEFDNTSVLFIKDELYYLGIMDKAHNKIFEGIKSSRGGGYKKIIYKLLPGANKMLPKVFFSEKGKKNFNPSQEILEQYEKGTHKKGKKFNLQDCHKLIDFFKNSIEKHSNWKKFNFKFSNTKNYKDISEFYREVDNQGYNISFVDISTDYISKLIDEGKLYLFQIYNKDFSIHSKGKANLHTLYWRVLFDEKNLKDVVYKLNGEAEIFYRKASLDYSDDIWQKGHHYEKLKDKFIKNNKYIPIIKDKRYATDKFLFHVPITINFKASNPLKFNHQINEYVKKRKDINVLSIDRGERHLAYYTLLDQNGNIKLQESFNIISNNYKGVRYEKNYRNLLNEIEKDRDRARKSWDVIGRIATIKEGYLSQVVHKISEIVIKHNAIVVFEDLNFGFKRGRFKIEKQVYQKLEKMLIDKLNYLVFKDYKKDSPGGVLNGYQLTAPFTAFKDIGKQTGIIYYVPAYHTSKICPATGFVNLLYPRYESVKQAQDFFAKFKSIKYNNQEHYFEFTFDYKDFNPEYAGDISKWTICTFGVRLESFRNPKNNNQWDTQEVDVSVELEKIFINIMINYRQGKELKDDICRKEDASFFKCLMHYFKLTLQMRNSRVNSEEDYLISPVKDKNGNFFDSRKELSCQPKNADANGAYHIGLKGLMLIEKINRWDGKRKIDLKITNDEWYRFIQARK